ncbi:MAG: cyclic nucleotide-binding domain-containing protein, partial [Anaerolineales bacterium]|nr:cyclic nucleotide-binding domain-containing protein [Anaerolineales bacterium]
MDSANPSAISDLTTAEFLAQHPLFWLITKEYLPSNMEPFEPATMAAVRQLLTERKEEVPELIALDKIAAEFRFKKGAILAHQGEYADNLHILREGMLESQYERFVELPNGTQERTYVRDALHLPGAWLSDYWVFQPMLYPYYLKARRDGCVILITREKFLEFLKKHPKALRRIYPQFTPEAQKL